MWFEHLWHDVRHGVRMFVKNPAFTAIAVVSIAFGTGANVAIFSAADALLLRPLPVMRPSELLTVGSRIKLGLATRNVASYADYVDVRERSQSFDGLLAYTMRAMGFVMHPGAPPQVKFATIVSGTFFRVLGVEPELGRSFHPDEDRIAGRDAVAVLSYGMWKSEFGGDPTVLGRKFQIAGVDFTIVGVAPERFTGIDPRFVRESVFVPLAMWPRLLNRPTVDPLTDRELRTLTVKGRLKPGVTQRQAQAELAAITNDLKREYPKADEDLALTAQTELEMRYERNPIDASAVLILSVLSLSVLCVACANVAGLLASRAPVRAREIALRLAVGAGRARIVGQLITESLGIAIAGAIGGLAVGYAGITLLRQYSLPTDIVGKPEMRLDQRALVFSIVLAVVSAFLFGLAPAIQMTRVNLVNALKASDATVGRRLRLTGRNALVALQVALSLVLLTVTVFALQIFQRELVAGPGFRTSQMVKLTIDPSQARYDDAKASRFFERVAAETRAQPGVRSAGLTSAMPFFGNFDYYWLTPEGYTPPDRDNPRRTWISMIDEGYLDTMGIPLLAGRSFAATDTADTPRVAIANDAFVRRYWPEGGAIGKRIHLDSGWYEIVGVAKTTEIFYPGEQVVDMVYLPFRQDPRGSMVLVASTATDSASVLAPVRDILRRIDPDVPVYDVQTIEAFYDARFASISRVLLGMIGGIGLMGITITMVGLYGLVSYAVSRRTRELGIRIAVGASYQRVVAMVLRQGMMPACAGVVVGLGLSVVTARILPRMIPLNYGYDSSAFFVVVPLLVLVTLAAAFVPARRAARVDPTVALRCD